MRIDQALYGEARGGHALWAAVEDALLTQTVVFGIAERALRHGGLSHQEE